MYQTDKLLNTLNTLAATPGKKDKQGIVAAFDDVERRIVKLALDPTINFYIAKLEAPTTTGSEQWGDAEFQLLDKLSSREITGHEALRQVGYSLRELTPESGELLRRVILRDLKCGVGTTIVNTAFPGLVPDFAYMRCSLPKDSSMAKWDWSEGVFSQLKANGSFARIDVEGGRALITTRQGNTYPAGALAALEDAAVDTFDDNTQSHGELTVWHNGVLLQRSVGNGILNSLLMGDGEIPADHEVRYDAWDQIPLANAVPKGKVETAYEDRLAYLIEQVENSKPALIEVIECRLVYSYAEAMVHYREVLKRKLEGTVLKHRKAIWKDGDSKDQVKLKLEVDVDLEIVGFKPGEPGKRTEHTFGSLICRTTDGLLEVSVSGFKRDMEQYLHENRDSVMHKIVCVRANEVSAPSESNELHSLYHPRFVELRKDKDTADTLQRVIDQFEAATA